MIHIFDKETRKYLGSRELGIQDGEELLYSENEIIGTSDGLCLDTEGNYYYVEVDNTEYFERLRLEYTEKISILLRKHIEKKTIDGTEIPKEILDERERLKAEYNLLTNKQLKK